MAKISLTARRVVTAVLQGRTIRRDGRTSSQTLRRPRWIVPPQRCSRARCLLVEAWLRRNSAFSRAWIRQGGTVLLLLPCLTSEQARAQKTKTTADEEMANIVPHRVSRWRGCLDDPAEMARLKEVLEKLQTKSWRLFLHDSPPCYPSHLLNVVALADRDHLV